MKTEPESGPVTGISSLEFDSGVIDRRRDNDTKIRARSRISSRRKKFSFANLSRGEAL